MARQTTIEDAIVRGIKLLDIGWATAVYFVMAVASILVLKKLQGPRRAARTMSTAHLLWAVVWRTWLLGVLAYVARNVMEVIPWPLEGVYGYRHLATKEVTAGAVFVAFAVTFDTRLQDLVTELKTRLT